MNPSLRSRVERWMERSEDAIRAAHVLHDASHWNAAVNRLYYACFYAVTALLKTQGLESSKHTGVRSLFNRRFVKDGHVEVPVATIYNVLFERRQECDYEEYADATEEEILDWMPRAEAFVSALAILTQEELDKEPTP